MTYSSNEMGANFDLNPEEHARFKAGKAITKLTGDSYGEYELIVKKKCVRYRWQIRDATTGQLIAEPYGKRIDDAVQVAFNGRGIARHHGACQYGNRFSVDGVTIYAIKRLLRPKPQAKAEEPPLSN